MCLYCKASLTQFKAAKCLWNAGQFPSQGYVPLERELERVFEWRLELRRLACLDHWLTKHYLIFWSFWRPFQIGLNINFPGRRTKFFFEL